MRDTFRIFAACILLAAACSRQQEQTSHSPYAGEEQRALKALSANEVAAYRGGHGMGLARVAELNHYPGPKHALELAGVLDLSAAQRAATQQAYDRMHGRAVRLGEEIVAREEILDSLFAAQTVEARSLRDHVAAISQLQGELRAAHLAAHLEMKKILSPAQVAKYDALRGYGPEPAGRQQHGSH